MLELALYAIGTYVLSSTALFAVVLVSCVVTGQRVKHPGESGAVSLLSIYAICLFWLPMMCYELYCWLTTVR